MMLSAGEIDALDVLGCAGVFVDADGRQLIRMAAAALRGSVFAFRPHAEAPGAFLVAEPGYPAATVVQRAGATGLAELHQVVSASPAWAELPGSRSAIDKRLRRAIAEAIAPPAPHLAEVLVAGLDVTDGAARWVAPWRFGRLSVQTT